MRADRLRARVEPGSQLVVQLPPDAPAGEVDVIVLYADAPPTPEKFASLAEFNGWLRKQPSSSRSREEIDQELAAERDAW